MHMVVFFSGRVAVAASVQFFLFRICFLKEKPNKEEHKAFLPLTVMLKEVIVESF